jgi:hypothetical protein
VEDFPLAVTEHEETVQDAAIPRRSPICIRANDSAAFAAPHPDAMMANTNAHLMT